VKGCLFSHIISSVQRKNEEGLQTCNDNFLRWFWPAILVWDLKIKALDFAPQGGRVYAYLCGGG